MPTRHLPSSPSLAHLKHQARDLCHAHPAKQPDTLQRIREFHPRFRQLSDEAIGRMEFTLSDAYFTIAREYGFNSWARLKAHVDTFSGQAPAALHERIADPEFREAVDLLDDGEAEKLKAHIEAHPRLLHARVRFEGLNYFREPALLEFIAENPVRNDGLPPNIVEMTMLLLDLGARNDHRALDATLSLAVSGRVVREHGVQSALIDLLCDCGANPDKALLPAVVHGEFDAVDALIRRGASIDLPAAAATGRMPLVRAMIEKATCDDRHRALALAAQHGHAAVVTLLLKAGENPDRYNPLDCHAHSTPLHQAALAGHLDVVRVLVEHGARLDLRDVLYKATPLEWAEHGDRQDVAAYLRVQGTGD